MKSHNMYIIRGISACYKPNFRHFKLPMRSQNGLSYSKIMHQINRTTIRLAYTTASYAFRPPQANIKYDLKLHPELKSKKLNKWSLEEISNDVTSNLLKNSSSKFTQDFLGNEKNIFKFEDDVLLKKQNIILSINSCVKPLDNFQIKNFNTLSEDKVAVNTSLDINSTFHRVCSPETVRHNAGEGSFSACEYSHLPMYRNNSQSIQDHVLFSSSGGDVSSSQDKSSDVGKPSEEQLTFVYKSLKKDLREFFVKPMNFQLYSSDIIFENRIRGYRTVGIFKYIRQMSLLRFFGHIKFAFVQFEILKITQHPEDSTVRVRWRIVGASALKSLPYLFTLKSYSLKDAKEKMDQWYDGFSTFYVGKNGLVFKHVADKMMPDEELAVKRPSLLTRMAILLGAAPKTAVAPVEPAAVTLSTVAMEEEGELNAVKSEESVVSILLGDNVGNVM